MEFLVEPTLMVREESYLSGRVNVGVIRGGVRILFLISVSK